MNAKVKEYLEAYVDGCDAVADTVNAVVSGKTGVLIGAAVAFSPIGAGALIGTGALYGGYKIAKYALKRNE